MEKSNILTYLENETSSFEEKPFSVLDSFVLAIASYLLFEHAKTPRSYILDEELPLLMAHKSSFSGSELGGEAEGKPKGELAGEADNKLEDEFGAIGTDAFAPDPFAPAKDGFGTPDLGVNLNEPFSGSVNLDANPYISSSDASNSTTFGRHHHEDSIKNDLFSYGTSTATSTSWQDQDAGTSVPAHSVPASTSASYYDQDARIAGALHIGAFHADGTDITNIDAPGTDVNNSSANTTVNNTSADNTGDANTGIDTDADPSTEFANEMDSYTFPKSILVRSALATMEPKELSSLFWFDEFASTFAQKLTQSARFADLAISDIAVKLDKDTLTQFSAMCFHVPDGSFYLSFRGTDNTITGWEEDFTLGVLSPIPSQTYAHQYTKTMMSKWLLVESYLERKPRHVRIPAFRLGGHSKGGNLAVYAASALPDDFQPFVSAVYNFDGPGVSPWQTEESCTEQIIGRITKIIPETSVFGRIFDDLAMPHIVKSYELALMQHMPFSWEIEEAEGEYSFIYEGKNSLLSDSTDRGLSQWISSLSPGERTEFCAVLFGVIEFASESGSIETLPADLLKKAPSIFKFLASLDKDTQKFTFGIFSNLLGNLADSFKEEGLKHLQGA